MLTNPGETWPGPMGPAGASQNLGGDPGPPRDNNRDGGDMVEMKPAVGPEQPAISVEALQKAEQFIEAEEGATNRLSGAAGTIVMTIAVVMSLFHLYTAIAGAWPFRDFPIIQTQPLRYTHVAFALILTFLLFPLA